MKGTNREITHDALWKMCHHFSVTSTINPPLFHAKTGQSRIIVPFGLFIQAIMPFLINGKCFGKIFASIFRLEPKPEVLAAGS